MQTVTNVFITNLALSDILVCINLPRFIIKLEFDLSVFFSIRSGPVDVLFSSSVHTDLRLWSYVVSRQNSLSSCSDVPRHLRYAKDVCSILLSMAFALISI